MVVSYLTAYTTAQLTLACLLDETDVLSGKKSCEELKRINYYRKDKDKRNIIGNISTMEQFFNLSKLD